MAARESGDADHLPAAAEARAIRFAAGKARAVRLAASQCRAVTIGIAPGRAIPGLPDAGVGSDRKRNLRDQKRATAGGSGEAADDRAAKTSATRRIRNGA